MRLLLIGKKIEDINSVRSFSEMQSYYLSRAFEKVGVDVFYQDFIFNNFNEAGEIILKKAHDNNVDHILALGVRYFTQIDTSVGEFISKNFKGNVGQIHDCSLLDNFPVDVNLTLRDDTEFYKKDSPQRYERHVRFNRSVDWAASNEIFYPDQKNDGVLRIFVDHATFHHVSFDYSLNIFMALKSLDKAISSGKYLNFKELKVRTLTDKGIVDVDLNDIRVEPFSRTSVPADIFANELRNSHIFFVTHKESLGLCVLESAFCGCYVLIPSGCISESLSKNIKCHVFGGAINWGEVFLNINPRINSAYVQRFSWEAMAANIVVNLIDAKKRYV